MSRSSNGARRSVSQSSGVRIKALIDLFQPRFRILGQSEALADGVVGGEIGTSSHRDRIVDFKAVEHHDFVGVQSYALPGDEGPVQHRRRVFAPCLDRQLGESDDQGLDPEDIRQHNHRWRMTVEDVKTCEHHELMETLEDEDDAHWTYDLRLPPVMVQVTPPPEVIKLTLD